MSAVLVRYRVKPGRAEENASLVRDVYAELAAQAPPGFRYATFVLDDGVEFVHIAITDGWSRRPAQQAAGIPALHRGDRRALRRAAPGDEPVGAHRGLSALGRVGRAATPSPGSPPPTAARRPRACALIEAAVEGFTGGEVPDYQMAAPLKAIRLRGMEPAETLDLTPPRPHVLEPL